jgi:hypothetical protein
VGWITPEGEVKASYNQLDSYPDYLGARLQREIEANGWPSSEGIRWVDEDDVPSEDDLRLCELHDLYNPKVGGSTLSWYQAMRGAQGSLSMMAKVGIALEGTGFLLDSLFCEWAYLLDERDKSVRILRGFNTDPEKVAPYVKTLGEIEQDHRHTTHYYGCAEIWHGELAAFLALDMEKFQQAILKEEDEAEDA